MLPLIKESLRKVLNGIMGTSVIPASATGFVQDTVLAKKVADMGRLKFTSGHPTILVLMLLQQSSLLRGGTEASVLI